MGFRSGCKKYIVTILTIIICSTLLFAEENSISILPFVAEDGVSESDAEVFYNVFISNLNLENFNVLEKTMLEKVMGEKAFSLNDFVEGGQYKDLDKIISTEKLVFGVITRFDNEFIAVVKLINVSSGTTEKSLYAEGKSKSELKTKMPALATQIFSTGFNSSENQMKDSIDLKKSISPKNMVDISVLGLLADNDIYAAGLSIGYIPLRWSVLNFGLWGGAMIKRDASVYPQGGVRVLLGKPDSITLTVDLGYFPSVGLNFKHLHVSVMPMSYIGYDCLGVTFGYYLTF